MLEFKARLGCCLSLLGLKGDSFDARRFWHGVIRRHVYTDFSTNFLLDRM